MREAYAKDFERARKTIAGHVMTERRSRSFDFRTPGKGSFYAYALTWSPGSVTLAGDIGEMTVTHWHAMHDFKAAMAWLADSDWDYLLGKTDRRTDNVIDEDATVGYALELAREDMRYNDGHGLLKRLKDRYDTGLAWGAALWRILKRELTAEVRDLSGSRDRMAEFCRGDLDIDDYYGAYRRHPHALAQITAIQRAARMILTEVFPYEWL